MKLFGSVDGAVGRRDRGFFGGVEPFDLASGRPAAYRGGAQAIWRPGLQDGLVWPTPAFSGRAMRSPIKPLLRGVVYEGADATILAFCRTAGGTQLMQADVLALFVEVVDMRTGAAVPGHAWAAISAGETVFDELQTRAFDVRWNRPTDGANFIHRLQGTAWPEPDRLYRYQCQVTEIGGAVWYVAAELECRSILRN